VLTAILLALVVLLVLAVLAVPLSARGFGAQALHGASLAACLVFVAAGLFGESVPIALPFATPFGPMLVALDGLSAWFLLVVGVAGACACLFALAHDRAAPARLLAAWPAFIAGMALAIIAADAVTLLLGFKAMSLAAWVLVAHRHEEEENRRTAALGLTFAAFAATGLVLALGLLAGPSGDLSFAAIREHPPEGWRAALILALVVAGATAGLVPVHAWPHSANPAVPGHVASLMSAAAAKVALYLAARLVLDLGGPAQPLWWGVPFLALGAASAVLGAIRANLETEAKAILAGSTIAHVGLVAIGLGLAACLRAADLGALAALAAGAALLHALHHAMFNSLLVLGMGEVAHGAGSRMLDRLGGLIHPMPVTAGCVLVGAAAAAGLPPLSGFAGQWLLFQAIISAWRVGDLAFQLLLLAAAISAATSAALVAAAMLRLFGLAFLGRPRTPRAAGAADGPLAARLALLLPAGLTVFLGLMPGPMLALGGDAQLVLAGHAVTGRTFSVAVADGAATYWPVGVALLLAACVTAAWALAKRQAREEPARGPAWDGGFAGPPPHLPFGDPLTQPSAAGFGQPLRRIFGAPPDAAAVARALASLAAAREAVAMRAERLRHLSLRQCLMLPFATLVALLALVAWLAPPG